MGALDGVLHTHVTEEVAPLLVLPGLQPLLLQKRVDGVQPHLGADGRQRAVHLRLRHALLAPSKLLDGSAGAALALDNQPTAADLGRSGHQQTFPRPRKAVKHHAKALL